MCTRSRITIKRQTKEDIYLWQHCDGYIEGVGKDLCKVMLELLHKFSFNKLNYMVEEIEEGEDTFKTNMLVDIFEGNTLVNFNESDDFEYEYVIDIQNNVIGVIYVNSYLMIKLPFSLILRGYTFNDIIEHI